MGNLYRVVCGERQTPGGGCLWLVGMKNVRGGVYFWPRPWRRRKRVHAACQADGDAL